MIKKRRRRTVGFLRGHEIHDLNKTMIYLFENANGRLFINQVRAYVLQLAGKKNSKCMLEVLPIRSNAEQT